MKQMKQKHWQVSVFDKTSKTVRDDTFYTTDTEAYLVFELIDEDFKPDSAMVTVYNIYGTAIISVSVEVADGIVRYEMPKKAIRNRGGWRTQAIFTKDNEDYTTKIIEFDVGGHLLDSSKPPIIEIENWNRLIEHAGELIDDWEQLEEIRQVNEQQRELAESARQTTFETNESTRQAEFETNETSRQTSELARETAESVRVANDKKRELNEAERISKDSERDSKIEAVEGLQADLISGAVDSAAVQQHVEERYGQLEEEYAPKLTEVTTQLAETATDITSIESANSNEVLRIKNYLGNYENIHPKVLYFEDGWNGYKYWMAYTPYPKGETSAENPCIAVSNDMINWTVPDGLVNPLDPAPSDGYNNDTHLVYRSDLNRLEIWWRHYETVSTMEYIYRRTTTDGINWTAEETIFATATRTVNGMVSPAVMFEDGKYKVWGCRGNHVIYRESIGDTVTEWSADTNLNIDWTSQNLRPWHLDVIKTDLGYEMIVCAFDVTVGSNNDADLFYVLQDNDNSFTTPRAVLKRSKNPTANDHKSIYRSSFIKVSGIYYVFYSFVSPDNSRGISLSYGDSIGGLNGFNNYSLTSHRSVRVESGTTLSDFNVLDIDTILITAGSGETEINSFVGGYEGKKITVVLNSSAASAVIRDGSGITLPMNSDYYMTNETRQIVTLVCLNKAGTNWKAEIEAPATLQDSIIGLTTAQTLTNFDMGDNDTLLINGNITVTIESLLSTHAGKKVNIIVYGTGATCVLKDSSRLRLPNMEDVTITNANRNGITLVCRSLAGGGAYVGYY